MKFMNDRKFYKLLLSPTLIYLLIWGFILFLYALRIVAFPKLSKGFYVIMILNIVGLVIGTFQGKLTYKAFNINRVIRNKEIFVMGITQKKKTLVKIFWTLNIIAFFGLIFIYIKVFSQISLLSFFLNQQYVKANLQRSLLGTYLSLMAYISLPIGNCLHLVYSRKIRYSIVPLSIATLYSISFWGRFPLLIAVIIWVFSKLLLLFIVFEDQLVKSYKFKITKLIFFCFVIFMIVFMFMSWTIELRISEYGDGYDPYASYYTDNVITKVLSQSAFLFGSYRAITMTYSYFVASIPTLSYWANMPSEYGLGQASFPYIYRLLHKIGILRNPVIIGDRVIGQGMQLPSLVGYLYIDFGLVGVFFFSYFLGLVGTCLHNGFLSKPSIPKLLYLSLTYVLIIFSPFTNVFSQTLFVIILVGSFLVSRFFLNSIN